ncbi:uncharacterized protein LOC121876110 [Homarus americanus]|uniref:uncharacterized protein LOC121876110 n=1 Tax=Homarus americanus TaxID=6706 RepID=UPI001C46D17B|nr:uncharacterized protein LOC121876110 [Homarus americanus]
MTKVILYSTTTMKCVHLYRAWWVVVWPILWVAGLEDENSLASGKDMVKVMVKSAPGVPDEGLVLEIRRDDLLRLQITQEDLAGGEVVGGGDGRPLRLKVKGRYFPLPEVQLTDSSILVFHSVENEEPYFLDPKTVAHLTLKSFQGLFSKA